MSIIAGCFIIILKVLLFLLLLVLALLLLVLFVPVCYEARARGGTESRELHLTGELTWLFRAVSLRISCDWTEDEGRDTQKDFRIFGFSPSKFMKAREQKKKEARREQKKKQLEKLRQTDPARYREMKEEWQARKAARKEAPGASSVENRTCEKGQRAQHAARKEAAVDIDALDADAVDKDVLDAGAVDADAVDTDATDIDATDIDATDIDATDIDAAEPRGEKDHTKARTETAADAADETGRQRRKLKEKKGRRAEKGKQRRSRALRNIPLPERVLRACLATVADAFGFAYGLLLRMADLPAEITGRCLALGNALTSRFGGLIHMGGLATDPRLHGALITAIRLIKKAIAHLLPRRASGEVTYGLPDPAITGEILAFVSVFYPRYAGKLAVNPVFDGEGILVEGELEAGGRIFAAYYAGIAISALLNSDIRYMIHIFRESRRKDSPDNTGKA